MRHEPLSDNFPPVTDPTVPDPALEAMQRERDELRDRLLRTAAEFENFRKRTERERREFADWATADLLGDVLTVLDDFERALAVQSPPEASAYRDGIELIHRQMLDLLKKRGVSAIAASGQDFDPALHQAVAHEEAPGARDGEILDELRRGYRLGDRLLRPAMVRVAKAS
ncbi:MAG: nucleotide exchange factor GrpE [Acidobacteriota bacterium]